MIIQNKLPVHYCEVSYIKLIEEQLLKEFDDNYSLYIIHPDLDVVEGLEFGEKIKNDTNYKIAIHNGNEVSYDSKYYDFLDFIYKKIVTIIKYSQLISDLILVANIIFTLTKVVNYLKELMMFFLWVIRRLDMNFISL